MADGQWCEWRTWRRHAPAMQEFNRRAADTPLAPAHAETRVQARLARGSAFGNGGSGDVFAAAYEGVACSRHLAQGRTQLKAAIEPACETRCAIALLSIALRTCIGEDRVRGDDALRDGLIDTANAGTLAHRENIAHTAALICIDTDSAIGNATSERTRDLDIRHESKPDCQPIAFDGSLSRTGLKDNRAQTCVALRAQRPRIRRLRNSA